MVMGVVVDRRSRACSRAPSGVSAGLWPFRSMMRDVGDSGPRLCGLGLIDSEVHSQSLSVFKFVVAWLHCGHVIMDGKQWLCLAFISVDCDVV